MNIFYLSDDPVESAQLQCDKHVVKMVTESAQMLSTVHRILDGKLEKRPSVSGKRLTDYWVLPDGREQVLYKAVHVKHPCTVWTAQNDSNYMWHWKHFSALCEEYTYRYERKHKADVELRNSLERLPDRITLGELSPLPLAMGSNPECVDYNDRVGSYRNFYQTKQKRFKMIWSKREVPEWFRVA